MLSTSSLLKSVRISAIAAQSIRYSPVRSSVAARFYSTPNGDKAEEKKDDKDEKKEGDAEKQDEKDPHAEALAAKDQQIADMKDRLLRTLADMENLRARTTKEVNNTKDYAIQKFAKDLLDTADILALALKNVPAEEIAESSTNTHLKNLHTGLSMTRDELLKTFKRYGVEPYDPINEKFDPNLHQANFQVPIPGKEAGTVFDVQKIGYMIKGRVLRPAQVGVVQSTDN
ncbi:Mitochondrial matrix cochaperone [Actinomortierella ambigua]|nr:Mitochondrial matrix cochaperone [Actinomortierella ambigua]